MGYFRRTIISRSPPHTPFQKNARYEIINDEEPYYGEVPGLEGVWSSGNILEKCRENLEEVIDEWVIVRLTKELPIPQIGSYTIKTPGEMAVA